MSDILSPASRVHSAAQPEPVAARDGRADIGGNADAAKDAKSSRSKERRRRGKDPLKDIAKSGKKMKELRELLKPSRGGNAASEEDSFEPAGSELTRLSQTGKVSAASSVAGTSQSGRSSSRQSSHRPFSPPPPLTEGLTGKPPALTRNVDASHVSVPSSSDSQVPLPQVLLEYPPDGELSTETAVADSIAPDALDTPPVTDGAVSVSHSPTKPSASHVDASLSPSAAEASCSSSTPSSPSRRSRASSRSRPNGTSWDWDGQSNFYRDPPPRFMAARKNMPSSPMASPLPLSLSAPTHPPPASLDLPSPAHLSPSSPLPSPAPRAVGRRTPTPRLPQTPPPNPVSAQTQIASLKGALEAAKMREEKNRLEAERLGKECDVMRWRWTEESGHWRRREAELHAYIQYLSQHLHMYAAASGAHLQAPGTPSFAPLSPMSPPTNFGSPYAYPVSVPIPQPAMPMYYATGHSSASSSTGSGSPGERGRRRERGGEDGEFFEGIQEGQSEEDDEHFILSDEVAGAILKRPESLGVKSRSRASPPGYPSFGNGWILPEAGDPQVYGSESTAEEDTDVDAEAEPEHAGDSLDEAADEEDGDGTPLADQGSGLNGMISKGE
ncbi:hypothetical protein FA95DRAFT_240215 [Auriscalpium vulgare]|uniref:Uncharacterized protein n=1 Tax=Auriscalpium vulgare TaxID=40419 RepID=A0ACB8S614_9AGAM|nr:hypothetical protein FA95DRAFT_240215 [Auriscalpium vulgare]